MRHPFRSWPALLSLAALGCGEAEPSAPADTAAQCEGRAEPLRVGSLVPSTDGALELSFVAAEPLPPRTGDNRWTLSLVSSAGLNLAGAEVVARGEMIDHSHGSPPQLAVEREPGVYELFPLVFTMPGLWTWRLEVGLDTDEVHEFELSVCAEP